MSLPTTVPKIVSSKMVYPKDKANNWGDYMNDNIEHLAQQTDVLKVDVRNKAKAIELSVAAHFDTLRNTMNNVAEDYNEAMGSNRIDLMNSLKDIIDGYVEEAVAEMLITTNTQLTEIEEIKSLLLVSITDIQSKFNRTEGFIAAGVDRILKRADNESEATASAKSDIVKRVKDIRVALLDHMADFTNPHEFDSSKAVDSRPVYQPDPNGNNAMMPLGDLDVLSAEQDEEQSNSIVTPVFNIGDPDLVIGTLTPLHQFILGKYMSFEASPQLISGALYYNGHDDDVLISEFSPDRAVQLGGDIAEIFSDGGAPLEIKYTWKSKLTQHTLDDFTIFTFPNAAPQIGDIVTIDEYPAGGLVGSPVKTTDAIIHRFNYSNKPAPIDGILSYAAVATPIIDPLSGNLKLDTLVNTLGDDESLIHWAYDTSINPGASVKLTTFASAFQLTQAEEVQFPLPAALESIVGTAWSDIEAIGGEVNGNQVAIYYSNQLTNHMHIFFEPDSNNISHEYLIEFGDNDNPIIGGSTVDVIRYNWDLTAASNSQTIYQPNKLAEGTANVVL